MVQEEDGGWMLPGRQTSGGWMPCCLPVPRHPLSLLVHGRKLLPVLMSGWVEGMLIPLTEEPVLRRAIYTLLNTTDEA